MRKLVLRFAALAACCTFSMALAAQNPPSAVLDNGKIKATVYLPDAKSGFYRCTRFDWAGMVKSVDFAGHSVYGQWFDSVDPKLEDLEFRDGKLAVGPCTAAVGIPEEFNSGRTVWGFDEAKPGETFLKIGVGVLRKADDKPYKRFAPYEIVDTGKWTVKQTKTSIEFTQTVTDPRSGYGYVYTKRLVAQPGKARLAVEHTLKNTGSKLIEGDVYNHNFTRFDGQTSNPDFEIVLPFTATAQVQQPRPGAPAAAPVEPSVIFKENRILFAHALTGSEHGGGFFTGYTSAAKDYDFRIENKKLGMSVRITADQPMARAMVWAIPRVFAVEPYLNYNIAPGASYSWTLNYDFDTLPASR